MGIILAGQMQEAALAQFAQNQGPSNSCGEFSVASALSLLEGKPGWLTGEAVVQVADRWTFIDSLLTMGLLGMLQGRSLRMWPNGPTTPWQVANLARKMAQARGMRIEATVHLGKAGSAEQLAADMNQANGVVVLAIAWDDQTKANMDDPNQKSMALSARPKVRVGSMTIDYTGHIMVLGGRDEDQKRWGFINSWYQGADITRLCWMADEDFEETWGYSRSPLFFPWMWVTIVRR